MSGELVVTPADTFLAHYGVPGMKWGKRKAQSIKDKRNDPVLKEAKAVVKVEKRNSKQASKYRKALSDKDLNDRIERLTKEKKLRELTEDDLRPGRKVAKAIISQSGQRVVSGLLVGAMAYGAKMALDRVADPNGKSTFDRKEAVAYMTPQNPNKKKK